MKVTWYKIKNLKQARIKEPTSEEIEKYLKDGYVLSRISEEYDNKLGHTTSIYTITNKTKEQVLKKEREMLRSK